MRILEWATGKMIAMQMQGKRRRELREGPRKDGWITSER